MKRLTGTFDRAVAAAASLTGKRFGLLVASSVVATSGIVASALSNPVDNGPLAALVGRGFAAESAPVPSELAPSGAAEGLAASTGGPAPGPIPPGAPLPEPLPSGPAPEAPAPEPKPKASPPPATPEAGRIKHVFVISLTSPGYEASFGAA